MKYKRMIFAANKTPWLEIVVYTATALAILLVLL